LFDFNNYAQITTHDVTCSNSCNNEIKTFLFLEIHHNFPKGEIALL